MPLVSGRNRWQYLYASAGLSCTETKLSTSSTFDCTVTGADTYFVAMGVAVSWNTTYMTVGTAYVLYHNYLFFSPSGPAGGPWSIPGQAGLKLCAVVSNVVTSTCYNITAGTNWPGYVMTTESPTNTWNLSLLDGATYPSDTYTIANRWTDATIGVVSNSQSLTIDTSGDTNWWFWVKTP